MLANPTKLEWLFTEKKPDIFQNIVEHSVASILVTDPVLQITYTNLAATRLLAQTVSGKSLTSFWFEEDHALLNSIIDFADSGGFFSAYRLNGFRSVIDLHPAIEIAGVLAADWDRDAGRKMAEEFLAVNPPGTLDVIWAASSEMALGAVQAVEAAGRAHEVKVFSNDLTPESVNAIQEGRLMAETHHGFAEWGWFGTKFAVMLALGQEVPPTLNILPRTVYAENAEPFYPHPHLEPIDWETIKAGHDLPEKITIGWVQSGDAGPYKTATTFFEKATTEAQANGINVEVVTSIPDDLMNEVAIIDQYIQQDVDVIILSTIATEPIKEIIRQANVAKIPVIIVNQLEPVAGIEVAAYIGFDNREAGAISGYAVTDYLGGPGVLGSGEQVSVEQGTSLDLTWWQALYQDVNIQDLDVRGRVAIIEGISGSWRGENRLVRADNSVIYVDTNVSPVYDDLGYFLGYTFVFQDATQRKQIEFELQKKHEKELQFQTYLETLHEMTIQLTQIDDLEEFYRQVIEMGTKRLGFDRLGLWLYNAEQNMATGTYGVDHDGNIEKQSHVEFVIKPHTPFGRGLKQSDRFIYEENWRLKHSRQVLGNGWLVAINLRQGNNIIGWLSVDNLIHQQPVTSAQLDILAQYGIYITATLARKQAEAALRESEARYRAIVESQVDLISRYRPDSTLTFVNDAYCEFYGKSREDLIGQSYLIMVAPEFHEFVLQETQKLVQNPITISGEYLTFKHNGETCWIQWMIIPIKNDHGQVIELQAIGRDVTRLKQVESDLERERTQLRTLIDNLPYRIYVKDLEGRFVIVNRAMQAHYAARLGADYNLLGKTDQETMSPLINDAAQTVQHYREEEQEIIQANQPVVDRESRLQQTDGSSVWELYTKVPFHDSDNNPIGLVGINRDITDSKQAEAAIAASEERLLQAINVGNIGIIDHDHSNDSLYLSPEHRKIYGFGPDEPITIEKLNRQIYSEDREWILQAIQQAHDPTGDGLFDVEHRVIDLSGNTHWVTTRARTFFAGEGHERRPSRTIGAVMDITDRKRSEAALQTSEERLQQAVRVGNIGFFDHDHLSDNFYASTEYRQIQDLDLTAELEVGNLGKTHPDDQKRVSEAVKQAHDPAGDGLYNVEYRLMDRSGEIRWLSTRARTFFEGEGKERHPVRTVGAIMDITKQRLIEMELETERTMLRTLIDHIPYRIYFKDTEGRFQVANHATHKYYSAWMDGKGGILGKNDLETLPLSFPNRTQMASKYFAEEQEIIQTGQPVIEHETLSILIGGIKRWETVTKVPLYNAEDNTIGLVGINYDITERKQVEEALRDTTRQLQLTVKAGNIGLWGWDLRTNKVFFSPEWKGQIGYTDEELEDNFATWESRIHPDDLEHTRASLHRSLISPWPAHQAEFRLKHKDGSYRWILVHGALEFDSDNQPVRMLGTHIDITERKQAELKRQESEQMLKTVLDNIPIRVFWKDKNFKLMGFNRLFVEDSGLPSAEHLIGKSDEDLREVDLEMHSKGDLEKYRKDDRRVLELGISLLGIEESQTRRDGKLYWLRTSKLPLRNVEDDIIGVLGIYEDITERKQAQDEILHLNQTLEQRVKARTQQLEAVNRELESFAYSVSHDLRAPLRSIDGFSQVLLEDYHEQLDDTGKDYLARVRRATLRMSHLIDDLLQLSRVTRREVLLDDVDLSAMGTQIADTIQESQPERQVEWVIMPEMHVLGDNGLLRIAVENLLNNAWKFTGNREQARIEFGSTMKGEEVIYYVKDNGAGFDMAHLEKLFGAFQRLHHADEFPGTGIGLATVQRIIRRHGGRVWAEGAIEHGATFFFTLSPE